MEHGKERPILFSGAMVKAILDGRKTMTRRVVKNWDLMHDAPSSFSAYDLDEEGGFGFASDDYFWRSPYGNPGDRLWVRETWATNADCDDIKPSCINECAEIYYKADGGKRPVSGGLGWNGIHRGFSEGKCRPSIFMPRWASRLLLDVKNIRVERLQDISEKDARAEGVPPNWVGDLVTEHGMWNPDTDGFLEQYKDLPPQDDYYFCDGRTAFKSLWDSINGKRPGCSWSDNPFVWVVEFERC